MDLGPIDVTIEGGMDYPFPPLIPVAQRFARPRLTDVEGVIRSEVARIVAADLAGKRIAITVGSRGIAELPRVIKALIVELRLRNAEPFIVPSMGSHGGATAAGQVKVLEGYGITEASVEAPIHSSMDVVLVDRLEDGTPLYLDKYAYEADGIVIANKVKPHADFKGQYESGLVKMLCVGLGKHKGAVALHDHGFGRFHNLLPKAAERLLTKVPVLFGLAVLENAYDDLMHLEAIPADQIMHREKDLLETAKASIGRLQFPEIDVLIVDEIGKNISGEGMDPNVTGRPGSRLPGFDAPDIQKIVALDVTPQSYGNGVGIGSADLTTRRCVEKINLGAMYTNAITATILEPAKLPMILNSDRDAICVALKTCNRITPDTAKIVRIKNTLEVEKISVSPALLPHVQTSGDFDVLGQPETIKFDHSGRII
ncbi:lactate racemase domain-containing protein [Labrenzia sp. PHM005]|uniref:lactate racemase domain-containing protein n=1 Tax=Labrenzia sp. PHM005 TaxID=2590016 RepID=UPI00113FF885|nr:lactate racemase domain-containing protein [Labrenzia sp. PHM005]QDG75402.1 hypothetical protein FJ695_05690 [Labrenzia sp. PHM005]